MWRIFTYVDYMVPFYYVKRRMELHVTTRIHLTVEIAVQIE